jgi:hypothetical protein
MTGLHSAVDPRCKQQVLPRSLILFFFYSAPLQLPHDMDKSRIAQKLFNSTQPTHFLSDRCGFKAW